jgi:hypothetical protein
MKKIWPPWLKIEHRGQTAANISKSITDREK